MPNAPAIFIRIMGARGIKSNVAKSAQVIAISPDTTSWERLKQMPRWIFMVRHSFDRNNKFSPE